MACVAPGVAFRSGRVYYDRHGRYRGYSVPLRVVMLKWLLIVGLIGLPVYEFFSLLGIEHSTFATVVTGVWIVAWLAFINWLKHDQVR